MHKKSGDRRVSTEEKENERLPARELSCTGLLLQFLDLGAEGSEKAPGEKQVLHETSPGCSSSSQDRKKAEEMFLQIKLSSAWIAAKTTTLRSQGMVHKG